jgi:hypothetical protein
VSEKNNGYREATNDKQDAPLKSLVGSIERRGQDKLVNEPPPLAKPGQVSVMLDSSTAPPKEAEDR